jgi:2-oxoglutarate dehydrogenase E1 component
MGAWTYIVPILNRLFAPVVIYAGRNASSSPAVGSLAVHKREQALIVEDAFRLKL